MKPYAIFFVSAFVSRLLAAENPLIVDWSDAANISTSERVQFWNQATGTIQAAGVTMPSNVSIRVEYMPKLDGHPFEGVLFRFRVAKEDMLWVQCKYPSNNWLDPLL